MLDIGGWEFLMIVVLGIIIIGPKELPGAIRTINVFVRKARGMARDFQSGLEEMAQEAELDKLKDQLAGDTVGIERQIEETIDPGGEIRSIGRSDWEGDDQAPGDGGGPKEDERREGGARSDPAA